MTSQLNVSTAASTTDPVTVWVDATNGNDAYFWTQDHPCKSLELEMIAVGYRRSTRAASPTTWSSATQTSR